MVASIIFNWAFGLMISKVKSKKYAERAVIVCMLLFNLSIIFVFKYLMFTIDNLNRFFKMDITTLQIILPIGISFFTFQAISYVIDIYRGKGIAQKNPLNVGLYISFFPQLIAGPIVRYETVADQIMNRKETISGFSEGVTRFLVGFSKKILLANNFALLADKAFSVQNDELSFSFAWFGAICYTLQIYFDFSGYSDMAIGLGRMFGFKFPENFNYPYISKSTTEFWRRWHISLGSWFRDYLYFPLGGSRVNNKSRVVFNLLIVWSLTGLWHGANWTFILWGLLYFVSISIEKLTGFEKIGENKGYSFAISFLKHTYTLSLVMFGWVLFRAANISYAIAYMKAMLSFGKGPFIDLNTFVYFNENWVFIICGIFFSMPAGKSLNRWLYNDKENIFKKVFMYFWPYIYASGLILLFLISLSYLVKGSYNPFIYFNF
jgi:D-alanyl-lipoteichoic acid acyltransferase DltB (MBOAT superfamily)